MSIINSIIKLDRRLRIGFNKILILLITLFINLLIAFKYLILLKFNHFYFVLKAVFPKSFLDFKYEYLNMVDKKNISKENNINTLRYYGIGAQIIKDLNIKNMILISRSKKKIIGLDGFGLKIKKQIIIK